MKSCIRGLSLFGLATLTLVSLSACESGEDRSLSSAQACLDGATDAAQAQVCVDKVAGLETQDAYLIRCSAGFIANGFIGQKIADAYTSISGNNNNSSPTYDPMVSIMAYLNFGSTNPNFTSAATLNNCQRSGVKSMYQLASAADLSSTIAQLTSTVPFDPQNPEASLQAIIDEVTATGYTPSPTELGALGSVVISTNDAFCVNAANPNQDICSKMQTAIVDAGGTSNPAALAEALLDLLKN